MACAAVRCSFHASRMHAWANCQELPAACMCALSDLFRERADLRDRCSSGVSVEQGLLLHPALIKITGLKHPKPLFHLLLHMCRNTPMHEQLCTMLCLGSYKAAGGLTPQ